MPPERPQVLDTMAAVRLTTERWRSAGLTVALVPTMGALHRGHRSLIQRARGECDRVVVSIFVNPVQFGEGEDYGRYPRDEAYDLDVCAAERVDAVYMPAVDDVYPPGFALQVNVDGPLVTELEGAFRPGHFAGVTLMVAKLLVGTRADRAYFGQKDAQQCAVVRRLARDLDTGTHIVVCPTVRDRDGLALSSRNAYLSEAERADAMAIPRGLAAAAKAVAAGEQDAVRVIATVREELARSPSVSVDYVAVVDPVTFEPVERMSGEARIQVAARIGATRLIDTLCPGLDEIPPAPARTTISPEDRAAAAG